MRILCISPVYPSKIYPNSVVFVHKQVQALKEAGHEVVVIDIDLRSARWKRPYGFYKDSFQNVIVYRCSLPTSSRRIPSSVAVMFSEYAGKTLFKKVQNDGFIPDVVLSNFAFISGNAGLAIKKRWNIPLMTLEHTSGFMTNSRHIKYMGEVYNNSDVNLAVSDYLKEQISKHFNVEVHTLPNIVDEEIFYFENTTKEEIFTFVSVSRLIKWKRPELLLSAFKIFFENVSNSKLVIIGSGDERENLIRIIHDNKLDEHVEIKGEIDNEKLREEYCKAHVFILPSKGETFGVVYIEAIACGLPVIATSIGGTKEFVNISNGLLIEDDSPEGVASIMMKIYNKYADYRLEDISKEILKKYGKKTFINRFNKYSELIVEHSINLQC